MYPRISKRQACLGMMVVVSVENITDMTDFVEDKTFFLIADTYNLKHVTFISTFEKFKKSSIFSEAPIYFQTIATFQKSEIERGSREKSQGE